jgi:hypothetical protein
MLDTNILLRATAAGRTLRPIAVTAMTVLRRAGVALVGSPTFRLSVVVIS